MENHVVTGAECPLTLWIDGQDQEFLATRFSDKDYSELDLWVQSQVISIARHSLRAAQREAEEEGVPVDFVYDEEMQIASKAAIGVSIYEESGTKILNTPKGVARMGWMLCRAKHPTLTHAFFVNACRNAENMYEIIRVMAKLNPQDARPVEVKVKDAEGNE